jgi:nitrate reductase NapAB chaperone NapD
MADLNIFGVAQPTFSGIRTILNLLYSVQQQEQRKVYWFCAREEPLIYINRKPFVLRDIHLPYENIKTYHGISAARLEAMEDRLKQDIKKELSKWNNLLLVHEEDEKGKIVPMWTAVTELQTTRELFQELDHQGIVSVALKLGYQIQYVRIPISPEQAPEDHYIDDYVDMIKKCDCGDPLVFNCGMGVV